MGNQGPTVIRSSDVAQAAMVELGAWAAKLDGKIREFAKARSVSPPAVVYRFSHPVSRALLTTEADVKLWEAYPPFCSASGVWEIHIHPREVEPPNIIVAALAGLASAIAGPDVKFGSEYGRVAESLGLAAGCSDRGGQSWRNAVADPGWRLAIERIAESLGAFPLGALDASKARRHRDRNFGKAICPVCGPTSVRLSRKTAEERIILCGGTRRLPHAPAVVTLSRDNPRFEAA